MKGAVLLTANGVHGVLMAHVLQCVVSGLNFEHAMLLWRPPAMVQLAPGETQTLLNVKSIRFAETVIEEINLL